MPSAFVLCVVCLAADPRPDRAPPDAADVVSVRLADGRTVRGRVDPRSDGAELWLVTTAPGVRLVSVFPRDSVERVADGSDGFAPPSDEPEPSPFRRPISRAPNAYEAMPSSRHDRTGRPRTLRVAAHIANWNADAAPDGLELTIVPLDDLGRAVPVAGTVDASLIGVSQTRLTSMGLDRWSRVVQAEDFRRPGAVYRLPFSRSPLPSRRSFTDSRRGIVPPFLPEAFVAVRLGVSGEGVLEAIAPVAPFPIAAPGAAP